jgi:hypothetical protein
VDLAFPGNGSTYPPLEVFPIALILHNANMIWPYKPRLTWTLFSGEQGNEGVDIIDEGSLLEGDGVGDGSRYWEARPNNYLLVNTSTALFERIKKRKNQKRWSFGKKEKKKESEEYRLDLQLSIEGNASCRGGSEMFSDTVSPQQILSEFKSESKLILSSSVTFTINMTASLRKDQPLPELSDCPTLIGILTPENTKDSSACPSFVHLDPPASCSMSVDAYITAEIANRIKSGISRLRNKFIASSEEDASETIKFSSGAAVMTAVTGTIFGIVGLLLSLWTIYVGDSILLEIA